MTNNNGDNNDTNNDDDNNNSNNNNVPIATTIRPKTRIYRNHECLY